MSTAIQNLETDHGYILSLIEVMEQITLTVDPNPEHLEMIVAVIREFADGLHHAKEENLLFPLMVKKGYSAEKGPVAVMLYEHQLGRNFVTGIAEGILQLRAGKREAIKEVYSNMLGYADLLKNHIAKENNVLFPMADKVFTETEKESLSAAFTEVEFDQPVGKKKVDYISQIETLSAFYTA